MLDAVLKGHDVNLRQIARLKVVMLPEAINFDALNAKGLRERQHWTEVER